MVLTTSSDAGNIQRGTLAVRAEHVIGYMRSSVFVQYAKLLRRYCNNFAQSSSSSLACFSKRQPPRPFRSSRRRTSSVELRRRRNEELSLSLSLSFTGATGRINLQANELLTCITLQSLWTVREL